MFFPAKADRVGKILVYEAERKYDEKEQHRKGGREGWERGEGEG